MSLYQIAKILEISGFVIATIFGTILFSKEFLSGVVENSNKKLAFARDKLNKWYIPIVQYLTVTKWFERIGGAIVVTFAEICIILGWLIKITWLFWLGLVAISPYVLFIVPFAAFLLFRSNPRMDSMGQFPAYLLGALVRSFILTPIVTILFLTFLYSFLVLTLLLNVVVKEDFLKKDFIISGSVIVIVGLILETIATW